MTSKVRKRIKNTPNPRARRPRAAQGQGVAARDVTSESEEDEEEGVEWGKRMYGLRMSPAHPRYVGRGDDINQRRDRKMAKKQVHTMATAEEVAPGSDWHFSVRTADGEVWLQGNSRVHTV